MNGTRVELFIDSEWADITPYVYTRNGISISRGRSDESSQVEPTRVQLTLDNRDGRFSMRNPLSPYYGKIGRNTPLRVLKGTYETETMLRLTDSASITYAETPADAAFDITDDIDIRVELTTNDWGNHTDTMLLWRSIVDGSRTFVFQLNEDNTLHFDWSSEGDFGSLESANSTEPLDAPPFGRMALRVTRVRVGNTVRFYTAPSLDGPWTQLGNAQLIPGAGPIFDGSTASLKLGRTGSIYDWTGSYHRMELRDGVGGTVVAEVDCRNETAGASSFVDETGLTWTPLAGTSLVSGLTPESSSIRATVEVASWPVGWVEDGSDIYAQIEGSGILRRLGQGQPATLLAYKDYVIATEPYIYWPLDDPEGSTIGANAAADFPTGNSYKFYGWQTPAITFGTGDLGETLPPGLNVPYTSVGYLRGDVSLNTSATAYAIDFVYRSSNLGPLTVTTNDYAVLEGQYILALRDEDIRLSITEEQPQPADPEDPQPPPVTTVLGTSAVLPALTDGLMHHVRLLLDEDGANVDYTVYVDGEDVLTGTATGRQLSGLVKAVFTYVTGGTETSVALGHVTVWAAFSNGGIPDIEDVMFALRSYAGETAGRRIERLCDEAAIPLATAGDLDATPLMGAQDAGSVQDAIEDAEEVDQGILHEPRSAISLAYRTRQDLYNQTPVLTLDYQDGVFGIAPEPVDDDRYTRNDVTARRPGGGSARAVLTDGALSTQAPPDGVGLYATTVDVNVYTDALLPDQANWRMRAGTLDVPRFPVLMLPLHVSSVDDEAVAALDLGDLVRLTGLPDWVSIDDVDVLVQAINEAIDATQWTVTLVTSPAQMFSPPVYGTARYDTEGSELTAGVDDDDTVLTVTSDGELWTVDDAAFPFDIYCGGERMTVTDVSGTSDPQTMTVTRSVNGVTKAHVIGESVRLFDTPRYGL